MGTRGKSFVLIACGAICALASVAVVCPSAGSVERESISPGSGWNARAALGERAEAKARSLVEMAEESKTATDQAVLSAKLSGLTWQPGDLPPKK